MYLPSLQPVTHSESYISGDVTIHPQAVVAPGAILQAAPNSRIVIGAGVCIGMGTVLNAYQGTVEVEEGAVLGAGVLIVGASKVGSNACVGTATTIFNASVEAMAIVPPGSLIGDCSRQVTAVLESEIPPSSKENLNTSKDAELEAQAAKTVPSPWESNGSLEPKVEIPEVEVTPNREASETSSQREKPPVVGKVYINQLLVTLFPHKQSLNRQNEDK